MMKILTIYSKKQCSFCVLTKNYLQGIGIDFKEMDVEKDDAALHFIKKQGHKTVPQLYIDDELFVEGGWQGLSKMTVEQIQNKIQGKK